MPYISKQEREELDSGRAVPLTPGQLNYCVTKLMHCHLQNVGVCYTTINAAIGVLECAKQEFYARIGRDYEANKERTNGDIGVLPINSSRENRAWAGGFFEGEGCFYALKNKARADGSRVFRTHASLTQKNEVLLQQFRNVVGCGTVYLDKDIWVWKTTKIGQAAKVFELLRPYLGERRQQTFLELDAAERKQTFRPPKPPRQFCGKGHDLNVVG